MSPSNLPTIPPELRQNILHYAMADAAREDLKLNTTLRRYASRYVHIVSDRSNTLGKFEGLLRYKEYREREGILPAYAPHLHALALSLRWALPEIEQDIVFVLEKTLPWFEEENEIRRGKANDEEWRKYWARHPVATVTGEGYTRKFPRCRRMRPLT